MFVEIRNRSGNPKLINVDEIESITSGNGYTIIFARNDGKWEDYAHDYNWWKSVLVPEITIPG